jgi:hypothetical protein
VTSRGVGEGYAVYRGPTTAGTLHRHAAFQVVIGIPDPVAVVDAAGVEHREVVLVVAPMERHSPLATPDLPISLTTPTTHCRNPRRR